VLREIGKSYIAKYRISRFNIIIITFDKCYAVKRLLETVPVFTHFIRNMLPLCVLRNIYFAFVYPCGSGLWD